MLRSSAEVLSPTIDVRLHRGVLWLLWLFVTTAGWALGSLLVLAALAWTTGPLDVVVHTSLGSAVLGALFGASVGGCQSFVLRRLSVPAVVWLGATTAIWAVAWALGQTLTNVLIDDYSILAFVPGGLLAAAVVSLGQWAVLRRYAQRASVWLACSCLGWMTGCVVCMYGGGGLLGAGVAALVGSTGWLLALAPGVIAGVLTGIALLALL